MSAANLLWCTLKSPTVVAIEDACTAHTIVKKNPPRVDTYKCHKGIARSGEQGAGCSEGWSIQGG